MTVSLPLGLLMRDVEGTALTARDRERLLHPAVGGVCLFAKNYNNPSQLAVLTNEIHALREPPLLVAVDQEGGRVQRFREGFVRLPPAALFGRLYDESPQRGLAAACDAGWVMAAEVRRAGVDLSFAPVLDVASCVSEVIGDRAFHADPEVVAELAGAFIRGMARAGMPATGKHFPGHGGVSGDTHVAAPVDGRPLEELEGCDLVPYRQLLAAGLAAVMTTHVVFGRIDDRPATFSRYWLRDVLRGRLGFAGVVFSDDLSMDAAHVAGAPAQRVAAALEAGCDMALVCLDPEGADAAAETIGGSMSAESMARVATLAAQLGDRTAAAAEDAAWQQACAAVAELTAERA